MEPRTLADVAELARPVADALMPGGREAVESIVRDYADQGDELDEAEAAKWWGQDVEKTAQDLARLRADVDGLPLQDAYGRLVRNPLQQRVAMAIVALGFTLHDCAGVIGRKHGGGVCLLPLTEGGGISVSWTSHDVALGAGAGELETVARDLNGEMNELLWAYLERVGFTVEPFGTGGAYQVTAAPADGWDPGLGG